MAITHKYTAAMFGSNLDFNEAYLQVSHVHGGKESITANVIVYSNKDKNEIITADLKFHFTPSMDGGNFIAQSYEFMKSLPEFVDAIDC